MNIKINNKIIWSGINMTLTWRKKFNLDKTLDPKKKTCVLGLDPDKTKINFGLDSDFNYIHFGIEINKRLKFLRPKMLGSRQFQKIFLRSFKFVRNFLTFFWPKPSQNVLDHQKKFTERPKLLFETLQK